MPEKDIMVYSLSTCGNCKSSMKLLDSLDAKYDFIDVDLIEKDARKPHLLIIRELNPKCSFPTLKIGKNVVVGFREDEIREAVKKI